MFKELFELAGIRAAHDGGVGRRAARHHDRGGHPEAG